MHGAAYDGALRGAVVAAEVSSPLRRGRLRPTALLPSRSDLQFICSRRGKDEVYACGVAGSKEQLAAQLGSCLTSGIPHEDPDDMKRRCDAFGTNTLPEKEALTFWQALAEAYDDFTLQTLTAAGIASIAIERASNPGAHLQDYMEGLAILGAVVVVSKPTLMHLDPCVRVGLATSSPGPPHPAVRGGGGGEQLSERISVPRPQRGCVGPPRLRGAGRRASGGLVHRGRPRRHPLSRCR